MLVVFSDNFVADAKIIFVYYFVAPLTAYSYHVTYAPQG